VLLLYGLKEREKKRERDSYITLKRRKIKLRMVMWGQKKEAFARGMVERLAFMHGKKGGAA